MPRNKSNKAKALARGERALRLRIEGATYRQIAADLSCSAATAYRDVSSALAEIASSRSEQAEELRALQSARLDALLVAVWDTAEAGDVKAIDRVLRIMERRARLHGIDAQPPPKAILGAAEIRVIYEE